MKKPVCFYSTCIICIVLNQQTVNGQSPVTIWENTIGGNDWDVLNTVIQTPDGGYLLGGQSDSDVSGDKTENNKGAGTYDDYWVIKTDANSNIVWQNTIGGSRDEELQSVNPTADGGYILGGKSSSMAGFDKMENNISGGTSTYDYWVIKISSTGIIIWQQTIGGSGDEELYAAAQTADGGYILGGSSNSNISGDKTENSKGGFDYWIIKLDAVGNIIWQKTIGGSFNDYVRDIKQTTDGGYIISGYSLSGISGDKTEPNMSGANLTFDQWIIKLSSTGSIEWQNTIGGSGSDIAQSVVLTTDGGYMIGGDVNSPVSGDVTEPSKGESDFWMTKLNSSGNIIWQHRYGGNSSEFCHSVIQDMDGGYVAAGLSFSNISGDKTEFSQGGHDYWIIKVDASGNKVWDKDYGGYNPDFAYDVMQSADGNYIIAGESQSGDGIDKAEDNIGGLDHGDYWLIKMGLGCIPETCNNVDDDCNGMVDDGIVESVTISTPDPITFCVGGTAHLTAVYTGATIQWKKNDIIIPGATLNNYTAKSKGNYTCESYSDCGDVVSNTIFVNVLKAPDAIISAGGPVSFCAGGSVVLTANSGPGFGYQWSKNGVAIAGATLINYTASVAGNYKCRVTKTATGCFNNSNTISVTVPCRETDEATDDNTFSIYPNPNNGTFTIYSNTSSEAISPLEGVLNSIQERGVTIYNSLGQSVYSEQLIQSNGEINISIDLEDVPAGIYFVRLREGNKYSKQKLIIDK